MRQQRRSKPEYSASATEDELVRQVDSQLWPGIRADDEPLATAEFRKTMRRNCIVPLIRKLQQELGDRDPAFIVEQASILMEESLVGYFTIEHKLRDPVTAPVAASIPKTATGRGPNRKRFERRCRLVEFVVDTWASGSTPYMSWKRIAAEWNKTHPDDELALPSLKEAYYRAIREHDLMVQLLVNQSRRTDTADTVRIDCPSQGNGAPVAGSCEQPGRRTMVSSHHCSNLLRIVKHNALLNTHKQDVTWVGAKIAQLRRKIDAALAAKEVSNEGTHSQEEQG